MKVNRLLLKENENTTIEEIVDFTNFTPDMNHVRNISNCKVSLSLTDFGEILSCEMKISADVIASCAYTLEDVPYKVSIKEKLCFSSEIEDDEDIYYEKGNEIEMDPYILSAILSNVPHNLHKKGATLPSGGNGYRVLSEEEFNKERSEKKKSSAFDCLDDLDLD